MLAFALRFAGLSRQSLWNDELSTWRRSNYDSMGEVIEKGVLPDVHPPGYQLLIYGVMQTLGDDEWALRLPSAFAGLLAVWMMYLLGRLLYTQKEGAVAAAMSAVLWVPLYYSQEARAYSLLFLMAVVTSYFWAKMLIGRAGGTSERIADQISYILAAICCSYLHYFGLFLVAIQAGLTGGLCVTKHRSWRSVFLQYGIVFGAFALWIPAMIEHLKVREFWIPGPKRDAIQSFFRFAFNEHPWLYGTAFLCLLVLLLSTVMALWKTRRYAELLKAPGFWLCIWFLLPILGAYAKSKVSTPILTNRNLIIVLPALYLLVARGFCRIPGRPLVGVGLFLAWWGFAVYVLLLDMNYYGLPHKQQFREAVAALVAREKEPAAATIISAGGGRAYYDYYFLKTIGHKAVDFTAHAARHLPKAVRKTNANPHPNIWVISAHRPPENALLEGLAETFTFLDHQGFFGANLWAFIKDPLKERYISFQDLTMNPAFPTDEFGLLVMAKNGLIRSPPSRLEPGRYIYRWIARGSSANGEYAVLDASVADRDVRGGAMIVSERKDELSPRGEVYQLAFQVRQTGAFYLQIQFKNDKRNRKTGEDRNAWVNGIAGPILQE